MQFKSSNQRDLDKEEEAANKHKKKYLHAPISSILFLANCNPEYKQSSHKSFIKWFLTQDSPPPKKHKSSHQALTSLLHQSSVAQRKASSSTSFNYLVICSKLIHMTEVLIFAVALLLCINGPSSPLTGVWGGVLCYECKMYVYAQKFFFPIQQIHTFPIHDHRNLNSTGRRSCVMRSCSHEVWFVMVEIPSMLSLFG